MWSYYTGMFYDFLTLSWLDNAKFILLKFGSVDMSFPLSDIPFFLTICCMCVVSLFERKKYRATNNQPQNVNFHHKKLSEEGAWKFKSLLSFQDTEKTKVF